MSVGLVYRFVRRGEEVDVVDLVLRVFGEDVGPLYSEEGIQEFRTYLRVESLATRSCAGHFVLIAVDRGEIIGMIEARDAGHICLLFVDGRYRQRGIARELVARAVGICRGRRPGLMEITVNSSPNSVHVYQRLGFRSTAPETTVRGIRFTPMTLAV